MDATSTILRSIIERRPCCSPNKTSKLFAQLVKMERSALEKEMLRENAKEKISSRENVELAAEETTGEDDFRYKEYPDVCAVVVDKGSKRGYAQVSGGKGGLDIVHTGRGETGYVLVEISTGQTCMLYGRPTVLYIHPRI